MKKILVLLLTFALCFSGCGSDSPSEEPSNNANADFNAESDSSDASSEETVSDNPEDAITARYIGDWNGILKIYDCTGDYTSLEGVVTGACARIVPDENGELFIFLGLYLEGFYITSAYYDINYATEMPVFLMSDYFEHFKKNFKQASLLMMINVISFISLFITWIMPIFPEFGAVESVKMLYMLRWPSLIIFTVLTFVNFYAYPIMVMFKMKFTVADNTVEIIETLKDSGRRVIAAALGEEALTLGVSPLFESDCIVIGNEGHGVSEDTLNSCTDVVKIPMTEKTESLNAAIAASVIMWTQSLSK